MKFLKTTTTAALALGLGISAFNAQMAPQFGSEDDKAYAALIWDAMLQQNLAGENAINSFPYEGGPPHGAMLQTFYSKAKIGDHTGALIVKRNYGPEDVEIDQIIANPGKHLGAITVMYKREAGYDADTQDWFWAKFLPDGSLDKNPKGMSLAGLVAKGADVGCISCHSAADGDDFIFTTNAPVGMVGMK